MERTLNIIAIVLIVIVGWEFFMMFCGLIISIDGEDTMFIQEMMLSYQLLQLIN